LSCNRTDKTGQQLSDNISASEDTIIYDETEEFDETEQDIEANREYKKKYIADFAKRIGIKSDAYISEFSDMVILPGGSQKVLLIPEFASEKRDLEDEFSMYIRLYIVEDKTEKIIASSKKDLILESDALIIRSLALNPSAYGLTREGTDFSVEVLTEVMGRSSPYSGLSTYLFVVQGDEVVSVLEDYTLRSTSTHWIEESRFENLSIETHFTVSTGASGLFRDIIATSDSVFEYTVLDPDKDQVTTCNAQGKKILKYKDGKYQ